MSLPPPTTNTIFIDLGAIAHNVAALKARVGTDVELMAVVKANAYGHGAIPVSRTALAAGATRLAVARIAEGVALRQAGIRAPILVMGYHLPAEAEAAVAYDLTMTVNDVAFARALSQQAEDAGKRIKVHVKVDTGMGRFGLLPEEVQPFLTTLERYPRLVLEGLWTHFATADERDKDYAWNQFALFKQVAEVVSSKYEIPLLHAANSAAILDLPDTYLNAVRPGIAIYGLYPSAEVSTDLSLRPALSLKSHVGRVRTLPAGASISYGRTFITSRPTAVALIPIGYGDGIHRLLSNRGQVLIHGQRAPIRGRVCMDNIIVDISDIEGVQTGDEVVLIGRQGDARISAEDVAAWAETINYEVTTSLLPRPRLSVIVMDP
ncbi:MAG: alanine racemase [Chloroflexi bacterium]|nr:alanine racemase [Chloroflexota bacterium]